MILVGIDPDLRGGIAVIDVARRDVKLLVRMPVWEPPVKGRRRIDIPAAYQSLVAARGIGATHVILECAMVKPQKSSKGEAMTGSVDLIHQNYGGLRAICELAFHRSRVVDAWPSVWKKDMGLTSEKALSRDIAVQLYPGHSALLSMTKNTGIAEAILLAEWGHGKLNLSAKAG